MTKRNDASHDHDIEFVWLEQLAHVAMARDVELSVDSIAHALELPVSFVRARIAVLVARYAAIRAEAEIVAGRARITERQAMQVVARECGMQVIDSPVVTEREYATDHAAPRAEYALRTPAAYRDRLRA